MDREMLIEAAKRSCEHDWLTNYLIPLCSKCGFTEDGFRYFNRGVEKGFAAALSLLQWRDVADGLPEVSGFYVVELRSKLHELDGTAIAAAKFEVGKSLWMNVRAYIPYPIPPYKQQSNEQN